MSGLMVFWVVLSVASLAAAVFIRVYPLMISTAGFLIAAVLGMLGFNWMAQAAMAVVLLIISIFLWARQTSSVQPEHREAGASRMSGMGALSNFSAFSDEPDEVQVDRWLTANTTDVLFRGRVWKAKLAKGAQARAGLYTVREVRDGQLILDEVID
jgi:membrane protein implicated in regulation of membrane protease activity